MTADNTNDLCQCDHTRLAHDDNGCNMVGCPCSRFREVKSHVDMQIKFAEQLEVALNKPAEPTADRPSHYQPDDPMEVINIIEHYELDFCLGNAIKYILRAGEKDGQSREQDLKKAIQYTHRAMTGEWQEE